ncbi:MAG: LPS export ABC transporter protein LptC [Psychromonas sp.]|jgi:LPS export ABC transporter protein LptC
MSKSTYKIFYIIIPVSILLAGMLVSCVNDLEEIKKITYDPKAPNEVTTDLEVFFVDSGYPKVKIFAKLAETYLLPEEVTKFKDGVRVDFFDEVGVKTSTLTALYGEIQTSKNQMMVRDSVVLYNYEKQQTMFTEELFWNQTDSLIFTDKKVKVISPDGIIYGKGIITHQDFKVYEFKNPTGTFNLK